MNVFATSQAPLTNSSSLTLSWVSHVNPSPNACQEIFFDSYIQQIFPTETEEYMKFLREMDYPRDGYKNIDDLKQIFLSTDEDDIKNSKFEINSSEILKFKNFESRAESINNFYFVLKAKKPRIEIIEKA